MKKRKYNRSGKYSKHTQDNVQSNSKPIEGQGSVLVPKELNEAQIKDFKQEIEAKNKGFTFEDLPLSIRVGVENIITYRENLKLPDDSKERKQRALDYWRRK